MKLDTTFIILSTLLIGSLIPLYIYRKKIFTFAYKTGEVDFFLRDLKRLLHTNYPKIKFDYTIVQKTKNEKDIMIRQTLIVEDMINQFFYHKYEKNTQDSIPKERLWTGYESKSYSNPKVPNDWRERKAFSWQRDNGRCNRCGTKIKLENSITTFAKDIADGGGYNFENIIILCPDCNKTINSKNPRNTIASLQLNDILMKLVEN